MTTPVEHSRLYSPSSIARRIGCHGSARLEDTIKDEGPKPAADYGTFGHHIAAEFFVKQAPPLESWLGKKMFGQVCDQELIDCVKQYLRDINSLQCKGLIKVESKVSLAWAGYTDVFGTADYMSDEIFGTLTVLDLKTGTGVEVYPEDNPQLMLYALMCAGEGIHNYESIKICISQPRTGGNSLKIWETTPDYLMQWFRETLEPALIAIESGYTKYNVTDDNCQWCKACSICPAYAAHNLAVAQIDFKAVEPEMPGINEELVNKVYPHLKMLKGFIKQVEAKATEMADLGSLQGFKLVAGKNYRSWKDEAEIAAKLTKLGIEPYEHKILTPAKAEKESKEVKKHIQPYIAITVGKSSIVPEADKRPALATLLEGFEAVV